MDVELIDVSRERLDVFDVPCCPFCDNEINESQEAAVVSVEGAMALAHLGCAEDARS